MNSMCAYFHRHFHGNALYRLLHQQSDHSIHATGLLVDSYLAIRPCSSWIFDQAAQIVDFTATAQIINDRSEEHTSELQSQSNLVCRLLLEKKKKKKKKQ